MILLKEKTPRCVGDCFWGVTAVGASTQECGFVRQRRNKSEIVGSARRQHPPQKTKHDTHPETAQSEREKSWWTSQKIYLAT